MSNPKVIVAMGVSGTGKSTLGSAIADELGLLFIDGDHLHPPENIAKMSVGQPLNDLDREPWLRRIQKTIQDKISEQVATNAERKGVVVACSALKRYYRDILRGLLGKNEGIAAGFGGSESAGPSPLPTYFVFIEGSKEMLMDRMQKRTGHFMKAQMLESQLNTLENPVGEEGVVAVSAEDHTDIQVNKAIEGLQKLWDSVQDNCM